MIIVDVNWNGKQWNDNQHIEKDKLLHWLGSEGTSLISFIFDKSKVSVDSESELSESSSSSPVSIFIKNRVAYKIIHRHIANRKSKNRWYKTQNWLLQPLFLSRRLGEQIPRGPSHPKIKKFHVKVKKIKLIENPPEKHLQTVNYSPNTETPLISSISFRYICLTSSLSTARSICQSHSNPLPARISENAVKGKFQLSLSRRAVKIQNISV